MPHIGQAALPMFVHGLGAEFVILVMPLVGLVPIDQMDDIGQRAICVTLRAPISGIIALGFWHQLHQIVQQALLLARLTHVFRHHARAAGKLDVFRALRHAAHVARQRAIRAPKIDLEDQRIVMWPLRQHVIQRRVGDHAAIPVILAVNFYRRESWRQRAGCHEMLGTKLLAPIVEVGEIARPHVHRAH
jgi:hypothetical protein